MGNVNLASAEGAVPHPNVNATICMLLDLASPENKLVEMVGGTLKGFRRLCKSNVHVGGIDASFNIVNTPDQNPSELFAIFATISQVKQCWF